MEQNKPVFKGRIGKTVSESKPWWPEPVKPPPGSPNVLIVLCDDLGFSDLGCYGSEISTPHIDSLAQRGLRYVNFHVPPMCSPTRASLLTGLQPHSAGVGYVGIADSGFPGYRGKLPEEVSTAAEIFRDNGYATFMVGKWHLVVPEDVSEAADKKAWPLQRGFQRFYGFAEPYGFTSFHHPHRLIEDNHVVDVDQYPEGYYLTDDLTDKAISMIMGLKAENPDKPFFMHLAHGAVHGPLQAKQVDIEKHRDRYACGWNKLRETRFRRQQELGVVGPEMKLALPNAEVDYAVLSWDALPPKEQLYFARQMEVYAAMVDNIDQNLGRLVQTLDTLGELDNTLIIFTSDNGASADGGQRGTTDYTMFLRGRDRSDPEILERDYGRIDLLGSPRVLNHYPIGWAMASNTPFRLYKMTSYAGGHQVPMILSWPAKHAEQSVIRRQYVHICDVLPTLTELLGLKVSGERNGAPVKPMDGVSFAATLQSEGAQSKRSDQYCEIVGNRAYYREGWEAVAYQGRGKGIEENWKLYDLRSDPSQINDLSTEQPERLKELVQAFDEAAQRYDVYPLDDGHRRDLAWPGFRALVRPLTLYRETPTFEPLRSRALIAERDFDVALHFEWQPGDEGMLVAHGDQGGGYAVYVEDGRLHFVHNALGVLTTLSADSPQSGSNIVSLRVRTPGKMKWNVTLELEGAWTRSVEGIHMLTQIAPFEGIDVGIDRRSPVSWPVYERHGCFPYSGRIERVVYHPGALAADSDKHRRERFVSDRLAAD